MGLIIMVSLETTVNACHCDYKDTSKDVGLILAGGRGSRLYELTDWRANQLYPLQESFA